MTTQKIRQNPEPRNGRVSYDVYQEQDIMMLWKKGAPDAVCYSLLESTEKCYDDIPNLWYFRN